MSFDVFFYGVLALFAAVLLGRGLVSSAVGFGPAAVRRTEDPARYGFELAIVSLLLVGCIWMVWRSASGGADGPAEFNPALLLLAPALAFWLVRALHTGSFFFNHELSFSRLEEPLQFWLLVVVVALATIAATWISLPQSWI